MTEDRSTPDDAERPEGEPRFSFTDKRKVNPEDGSIRPSGDTPAAASSSSFICRWVEEAGWSTQVLASATWVAMEASFSPAINFSAAARPPFTPKMTTPQVPLGRYFLARS